jgi:hypothetical protein
MGMLREASDRYPHDRPCRDVAPMSAEHPPRAQPSLKRPSIECNLKEISQHSTAHSHGAAFKRGRQRGDPATRLRAKPEGKPLSSVFHRLDECRTNPTERSPMDPAAREAVMPVPADWDNREVLGRLIRSYRPER